MLCIVILEFVGSCLYFSMNSMIWVFLRWGMSLSYEFLKSEYWIFYIVIDILQLIRSCLILAWTLFLSIHWILIENLLNKILLFKLNFETVMRSLRKSIRELSTSKMFFYMKKEKTLFFRKVKRVFRKIKYKEITS